MNEALTNTLRWLEEHNTLVAGRYQKKIAATLEQFCKDKLIEDFPDELLTSLAAKGYYLELIDDVLRANPKPPVTAAVALAVAECIASDAFFAEIVAQTLTNLSAHGQLNFAESAEIVAQVEHFKDHIEELAQLFAGDADPEQLRADNTLAMIQAIGENGYYTETVCGTLLLLKNNQLLTSENAPTLIKLIGDHGEFAEQVALLIEKDPNDMPSFETVLQSSISLVKEG